MVRMISILLLIASPALAADPQHGRAIFIADGCAGCHGTMAQGGPGIRLAPSPPPPIVISAYIRNPAGEMPPYGSKVLTDADIADIHAYLMSIPASPKLADIPELN